ncbi:MAG: hypothetical protein IVW54_22935 [Candidatus Binataceae bacterium]|nr:hypothetical protein [Candidatus Binataceae bacterium]
MLFIIQEGVGSGFGVIVLKGGVVIGADVNGGVYDGKYTVNESKGIFEGTIKLTLPPGIPMVTGASASQTSYTQEFPILSPLDIDPTRPVLVQTPTGPVNIKKTS